MPSKNKNILYICTRLWFESSVFFRYSKNTLVFRNIEVSNTLRCLALVKSVVLYTLICRKLHYVEKYTLRCVALVKRINEGTHKGKPKKFLNEIEDIGQSN